MSCPACRRRVAGHPAHAPTFHKWTSLGATLAAVAIGAWHVVTTRERPAPAPVAECSQDEPTVVVYRGAAPPARPVDEAEAAAALDGDPLGEDSSGLVDIVDFEDDLEHDERYPLIVGYPPVTRALPPMRLFRDRAADEDGDDEWEVYGASVGPRSSGAGSARSCADSASCLFASLTGDGPVPDHFAGEGYLFRRARDDFQHGQFRDAARGFQRAMGRLPEVATPALTSEASSAVVTDRVWLCRSAAVAWAGVTDTSSEETREFRDLCPDNTGPARTPRPEPPPPPIPSRASVNPLDRGAAPNTQTHG